MHLVDGIPSASLPADDRGFAYGDGLFETIALCAGRLLAPEAHFERLALGAGRLGITVPNPNSLLDEILELCGRRTRGVVKIILTRGSGGRGYRAWSGAITRRVISFYEWPADLDVADSVGLRAFICKHPLSVNTHTAGIKHLNRLDQVMASSEWPSDDYFEGLMLDDGGLLIEGIRSNVFLVNGATVTTPKLDRCGVRGIVRAAVMDHCREKGIQLDERDVALAEVGAADEIFVTNSIIGLRSLQWINAQRLRAPPAHSLALEFSRDMRAAGLIP